MMVDGNVIDLADLPQLIKGSPQEVSQQETELISFDELQRRHLVRVLEKVGGNKARAAEVLGVSRTTIYEMLSTMDSKPISSKAKEAAAASTS
jgi:two-component system response regulator HydG